MGSKADFYIGRGKKAEWLGSIAWDGMPAMLPRDIIDATTEDAYRRAVLGFLNMRGDRVLPEDGWPWEWDSSSKTKYAYALDEGKVYACCFGSSWWIAADAEPDHTTLTFKAAKFPKMK